MDAKTAEELANTARDNVEAAEKELARASIALAQAKVVPAALETLKSLKETSYLVWKICNLKNWDDESQALYEQAQAFEDELAVLLLGAGERRRKLFELDPERWPLEGEHKTRAGHYPTDEDAALEIATSFFDKGFGRGSQENYDAMDDAERAQLHCYRQHCIDVFGEVGSRGFGHWIRGRHDT